MVEPVQTCCACARCAAAIHLESQSPETLRRAAARERLPRRLAPAILVISNDAAPGRRWLQKMFSPEKAAPKHPPAKYRRLCFRFAREAWRQMRGYTRCSSRARRVFAILRSPRPARRQFQERVRPNPCRTKATELLASASCAASTTKHKTSSRTHSQKHVQSAARERLARNRERPRTLSRRDYRRPAQHLAIEEARDSEGALTGKAVPPKTVVYTRTEWIAKRVYDREQLLWRKT
jgi:hypothetical protein